MGVCGEGHGGIAKETEEVAPDDAEGLAGVIVCRERQRECRGRVLVFEDLLDRFLVHLERLGDLAVEVEHFGALEEFDARHCVAEREDEMASEHFLYPSTKTTDETRVT